MAEDSGPFDLVVLGAGPGGYVAAIRAAQLGMKVACVDKDPAPGGTCLNIGCIPSKALLQSSHLLADARDHFAEHGIRTGEVSVDLPAMMKRKDKVVTSLTRGVASLFKKNHITWIVGRARLAAPARGAASGANVAVDGSAAARIVVETEGGKKTLDTTRVLIATGSVPIELPELRFDGGRIIDSTAALSLPEVPGSMVVVGAGAIGLELGSVWRRLGAEVTVVELTPGVVPGADREMAELLRRALERQGMRFRFETRVERAVIGSDGVRVGLRAAGAAASKGENELVADVVLVAVGRRAWADGLGLDAVGIDLDPRGRIPVDEHYATRVPGYYAIGDVIAGPMLAHKAEEEGVACVERMAGIAGHVNYDAIPNVVYTHPELASVGMTEEAARAAGLEVRIGRFPFIANGRAKTMGDTDGAVKILADAASDRIVGVHIVGGAASDLIAEAAVAIELGASAEDIARSVHAHPTLPEAVKEAALGVDGRSIHV